MSKEAMKLALEALEMVNRTDLSQVNLAIAAIEKAQADQAQQKPFGYIKPGEGDYEKVFSFNRNERTGYTQEVYTIPQAQPAQQEPLTDEQIVAKAMHLSGLGTSPDVIQFARAIEAAHGIKENT